MYIDFLYFNKYNIKLCCWIFWHLVWIGSEDRLGDYTSKHSRQTGIIECPNCLANRLFPEHFYLTYEKVQECLK